MVNAPELQDLNSFEDDFELQNLASLKYQKEMLKANYSKSKGACRRPDGKYKVPGSKNHGQTTLYECQAKCDKSPKCSNFDFKKQADEWRCFTYQKEK